MTDAEVERILNPERPTEALAAKAARLEGELAEALADRDRLAGEVEASDDTARRFLAQRQEMASERYEWQERARRAEAVVARARDLHSAWKQSEASPNSYCAHCEKDNELIRWPCATIAALDGGGYAS